MDRKYYIVLSYQRKGPYNIEELKKQNITKDTLIWSFEFNDPVKAGEIPEFASIWEEVQAPQETNETETPPPPQDLTLQETNNTNIIDETKIDNEINTEQTEEPEKKLFDDQDLPKITDDTIPPVFDEKTPDKETKQPEKTEEPENKINEENKEPADDTLNNDTQIPPPLPKKQTSTSSQSQTNYDQKNYTYTSHKPANTYLVWSIFSFLLCNVFAIATFLMGVKIKNMNIAGQYEEARKLSTTTLIILITTTILSWVFILSID